MQGVNQVQIANNGVYKKKLCLKSLKSLLGTSLGNHQIQKVR